MGGDREGGEKLNFTNYGLPYEALNFRFAEVLAK
jgi:hypothetical protein